MLFQFFRPVTLGKKTYGRGVHDVLGADASGWFFDALRADGSIVPVGAAKKPQQEPAKATVTDAPADVTEAPSGADTPEEKPAKRARKRKGDGV